MASPRRGPFAFPVYQIDFSAVAAGKHVAASKRRVRWRFGFPNRQALEAGRTGTECRGEEHDVIVIWSVASGKRQVLMDGKEVHYSSNRTGILDHSWSTRANHVIKVVCHAAPPMTPTPGFRQYDLFIDGQSFFTMPKVYELGLKGPIPSHDRVPGFPTTSREAVGSPGYGGGDPHGGGLRAPRSLDEEEEEVRRAIQLSLEESKRHLQQKASTGGGSVDGSASAPPASSAAPADVLDTNTADLLDFGGPSPAAPLPALPPTDQASFNSYGSGPYGAPPQPYGASAYGAPPPPSQYQQQPPQSSYYGGPPPPPSTPQQTTSFGSYQPGPPPQQALLALPPSTNSQQYYGAPPPVSAPAYGSSSSAYGAPPASSSSSYQDPNSFYGAPAPSSYVPDAFGLHTPDDPFAPKPPSHNDIANDILKAYGSATSTPTAGGAGANAWGGAQPYNVTDNQSQSNSQQPGENGGAPSTSLTMSGLVQTEEEPANPFEAALKKLVNVDHIDQPAEEKLKLTMKREEDEKAKKLKNKSKGLPPAAHKVVGSQATLAQIQTVKPSSTSTQKKEVMRPPPQLFSPDAAMAGALVIHGAPMPLGPPPLQAQGFGVGFRNAPMMGGAGMAGGGIGFAQQPQIYGAAGQQPMYYPQQGMPQQQQAPPQPMMYGQPPPPPQAQYQYR